MKKIKKKKKIEWERDLTFHTVERIPAASGIPWHARLRNSLISTTFFDNWTKSNHHRINTRVKHINQHKFIVILQKLANLGQQVSLASDVVGGGKDVTVIFDWRIFNSLRRWRILDDGRRRRFGRDGNGGAQRTRRLLEGAGRGGWGRGWLRWGPERAVKPIGDLLHHFGRGLGFVNDDDDGRWTSMRIALQLEIDHMDELSNYALLFTFNLNLITEFNYFINLNKNYKIVIIWENNLVSKYVVEINY